MMPQPQIYVDFNNSDASGRLRLNCIGTMNDLARHKVELRDGLPLLLYSDDLDADGQPDQLLSEGVVSYSEDEHIWVATIDWAAIRHRSDRPVSAKGS